MKKGLLFMKEILGYDLNKFFSVVDPTHELADLRYAGRRYEVWEIPYKMYEDMCFMSEENFLEIAGENAWWRSADGSNLDLHDVSEFTVNGRTMKGWKSPIYEDVGVRTYKNLSEYLCECVGASQPKNVCACTMDLARFNNMTLEELFATYEG